MTTYLVSSKLQITIILLNIFINVLRSFKVETLYNVLLSGEGKKEVNGKIVKTLSPSNNIAKLYEMMKGYKEEEKEEIIKVYNEERKRKSVKQKKV